MTGKRYVESLRDEREVWLDGQRVRDVPNDPAFKDMVGELARVYDLQNSDQYRDDMTYVDQASGLRTSVSWLMPRSAEDWQRKRRNSELWNELTWGQLGRSPDILAPFIVGLAQRVEELRTVKHPKCDFGDNALNYYRYCLENDVFLTHALVDPQVDRGTQPQNERRQTPEEEIALHVEEETSEGIIVSGGKQLATAAPHSNECYISLSSTYALRNDPRFVLAFAIPTNTPGLKIIAREPLSRWFGSWGHPLLMLDEQDCTLVFERVLVPWERVFMLYDNSVFTRTLALGQAGQMMNFVGWANLARSHTRMKLITAVATLVAESIGVIEYREVAAKLGEMATYCEMWRHAMDGVEHRAYPLENGLWSLGSDSGMRIWAAQVSSRLVQLLREICGSGIIMQPSENDLASPELRPHLDRFMGGRGVGVEYKSRLFRLAHELAASSYGARQEIYEYWHGGDPNRNRITLLRTYDQSAMIEQIKELCSKPLRHGEVP